MVEILKHQITNPLAQQLHNPLQLLKKRDDKLVSVSLMTEVKEYSEAFYIKHPKRSWTWDSIKMSQKLDWATPVPLETSNKQWMHPQI